MSPATALVVFPAAAAVLFPVAALAMKRSSQLGVDVWQTAFVANLVGAVTYSLLWLLGGPPLRPAVWWQPILIAVCLFGGMTTQFLAFNRGEVSVAVPVMGMKILVVAFLTPVLVGEEVRSLLWISALLSVVGVAFLNWRSADGAQRSITTAIVAGCAAAFCFGTFDILVQKWGREWGAGRLLPMVFWLNGLLSLICVKGFKTPLRAIPRAGWQWLLTGSLLVSLQSILFIGCLATYGQATKANITYSARGLMSVLLVWTVGHHFGNAESSLGAKVLCFRVLGATCLLAAIVIAMSG